MNQLNKITRKCFLALSVLGLLSINHMNADHHNEKNALSFKMKNIQDKDVDLKDYKGKVLLMVNVASKCGYTPQYDGLQKLHGQFKDQGFR
jgi:glutathione peroxidase